MTTTTTTTRWAVRRRSGVGHKRDSSDTVTASDELQVIDFVAVSAASAWGSENVCLSAHELSAFTCANVALVIASLLLGVGTYRLVGEHAKSSIIAQH